MDVPLSYGNCFHRQSTVLIVTEPTVSGKHDMQRVIRLADHFNIPAFLYVNKFDLNKDLTNEIEKFAEEKGLTCLGHIPFDQIFTKAMVQGQTIFEYDSDSPSAQAIRKLWESLSESLCLR